VRDRAGLPRRDAVSSAATGLDGAPEKTSIWVSPTGRQRMESPMPPTKLPVLDRATERRLAAGLFNETWRLLDLPKRRPEQDDEMIHAAHASRYHWGNVGEPVTLARGEWLCSRVYAVLGRAEPAIWHAQRCLDLLTEFGGGEDWDEAAAYEALARAYAVAGDRKQKDALLAKARQALKSIKDPDDRQPIEEDLKTIK
jgi:hypothetical protein